MMYYHVMNTWHVLAPLRRVRLRLAVVAITLSGLPACSGTMGDPFDPDASVPGGEPVSIELSLNDDTPEVGQIVTATARLLDAEGREVDAHWTTTVVAEPGSDAASVTVD